MIEHPTRPEATPANLFEAEKLIRLEAERLLKNYPVEMLDDPALSLEFREFAAMSRRHGLLWHMAADLLMGVRGSWPGVSTTLRAGYKREAANYNAVMK